MFDQILANEQEFKMLTLNDEYSDMKVAEMAQRFFQAFLPDPSQFELDPSASSMNPFSIRNPESCEIDPSILPPTPPAVDPIMLGDDGVLVQHREVRFVLFSNAILQGVGFGLGLLLVYSTFQTTINMGKKRKKSTAECENRIISD